MKKLAVISFALLTIATTTNAQDWSYMMKSTGKVVNFEVDTSRFIVSTRDGEALDLSGSIDGIEPFSESVVDGRLYIIEDGTSESLESKLERIRSIPGISNALPILIAEDGRDFKYDPGRFSLRFHDDAADRSMELLESWGYEIDYAFHTPGYYLIRVPETSNVFETLANVVVKSEIRHAQPIGAGGDAIGGGFEYVELRTGSVNEANVTDTYFSDQWNLNNTGQTVTIASKSLTVNVTPGNDISAIDAWNLTKGDPGTVIVVVDAGFEEDHPDLDPNLVDQGSDDWNYDSNLPASDKSPYNSGDHGTAVAGVAAAPENGVGIVGVAPQSSLIVLRVSNTAAFAPETADAINSYLLNEVTSYDAMVLVSSMGNTGILWPDGDEDLNAALSDLRDEGVSLVYITQNYETNVDDSLLVSYPGNLAETLAIAAMEPCSESRKSPSSCDKEDTWGSNYAQQTFAAAPGVWIHSPDQIGNGGINFSNQPRGYSSSDGLADRSYTRLFNGSSAAAPQVAGTIALMLSVNNGVTPDQIEAALKATSEKTGGHNYNWNAGNPGHSVELGYGRVNAYEAVKYVIENHGGVLGGAGETITFPETFSIESPNTITIAEGTTVIFEDDLKIKNGATLIIEPGVTLTFNDSWGRIISYGKVIADATGGSNIEFIAGTAGTFGGLYLMYSGADDSFIKRITVEDSEYGIRAENVSGLEVNDITSVNNATYGMYTIGLANAEVNASTLNGNDTGIFIRNGGVTLSGNDIRYNSWRGIYSDNASTTVFGASAQNIVDNSEVGVVFLGASGNLGGLAQSENPGNSLIVGDDWDVSITGNSYVDALCNFWSNPVGSKFYVESGSTFNYTPHGNQAGCSGWTPSFKVGRDTSGDNDPVANSVDVFTVEIDGNEVINAGLFVRFIQEVRDNFNREVSRTELLKWVDHPDSTISGIAKVFFINDLLGDYKTDEALVQGEVWLQSGNTPLRSKADIALAILQAHVHQKGDLEIKSELIEHVKNGDRELYDSGVINDLYQTNDLAAYQQASGSQDMPRSAANSAQSTVYPNPFNPRTRIAFVPEETGSIELSVYDGLGRKLLSDKRLVEAGRRYEHIFDGTGYPSGIYFYSISQRGSQLTTGAMMLLK